MTLGRLAETHLPADSRNYCELNKLAASAGSIKAGATWLREGKGLELGQEKKARSLKLQEHGILQRLAWWCSG